MLACSEHTKALASVSMAMIISQNQARRLWRFPTSANHQDPAWKACQRRSSDTVLLGNKRCCATERSGDSSRRKSTQMKAVGNILIAFFAAPTFWIDKLYYPWREKFTPDWWVIIGDIISFFFPFWISFRLDVKLTLLPMSCAAQYSKAITGTHFLGSPIEIWST